MAVNDEFVPRPKLKSIERQVFRHWAEDGLEQIVNGAQSVLAASLFPMGWLLPVGWITAAYFIAMPLLVGSYNLWRMPLVLRLKNRITVPRTGYVEPLIPGRRRAVVGNLAVLCLVLLLLGVLIARSGWPPHIRHDPGVRFGDLVGDPTRWWVFGIFWVVAPLGLLELIRGSMRLRRFLRDHPPVGTAASE